MPSADRYGGGFDSRYHRWRKQAAFAYWLGRLRLTQQAGDRKSYAVLMVVDRSAITTSRPFRM